MAVWLVGLGAVALTTGCGGVFRLGELDPPEGRLIVVDVVIDGNDELSSSEITAQLSTHSDNLSVTGEKPYLDRAELPVDARRVESIYQAHGYFHARVLEYSVEPMSASTVRVHFSVEEGPPTHVTAVKFRGVRKDETVGTDDQSLRLREIAAELPGTVAVEVGDIYSEEDYEGDLERLKELLESRGFIFTEVVGDVFVQRETNEAQVYYRIANGPLARIRDVLVKGGSEISEERILRRVDLVPGEVVDPETLRETEQNIYDLGVFFSVSAQPKRPSLSDKLEGKPATYDNINALEWEPDVTIEVAVQEMPMHEVRAGVGAEIDNKRSEAHVSGGYQHRNLFGGLRYFDAQLTPALIVLPSFFDPLDIAPGGTAELLFQQPSLFEEYLLLSVSSDYKLDADYGYQSHAVRGSPMLSRRFFQWLTLFVAYHVEYYNFFNITGALRLPVTQTLGVEFRDSYLLSYLEQGATADFRDNVYDPHNGAYISVTVDESLNGIGSDFHYYRVLGDVRGYVSPWSFLTLAARAKYGHVFNELGAEVPLPARFKGGGPSDMRGFGAGRMGPVVCSLPDGTTSVTTDDVGCPSGSGTPLYTGGNVMFEGSFETRWTLPANFGLVAFVDVGEVWAKVGEVDFAELNVAVGPGLRYFTPFGPLRADVGFLLTAPDAPDIVFHLSIGQAF